MPRRVHVPRAQPSAASRLPIAGRSQRRTADRSRLAAIDRNDLAADYDAVLIVSFGGPERPEDVIPFLENVVRGKPVPRERLLEWPSTTIISAAQARSTRKIGP